LYEYDEAELEAAEAKVEAEKLARIEKGNDAKTTKAERKALLATPMPSVNLEAISRVEIEPALTGYFKKPSLETLSAMEAVSKEDPIKSGNVLFNGCWLGGDNDFNFDDEVKIGAIKRLSKVFVPRLGKIKKL